jgi:PAS domain-containing protein
MIRTQSDLGQLIDLLQVRIDCVDDVLSSLLETGTKTDVDLELALEAMLRACQLAAESEWRLTHLLEKANDGVFRFDMRGVVDVTAPVEEQVDAIFACCQLAWCNDATAKSYGYSTRHEVIGKWLHELMPPELPENRACIRAEVVNHYRLLDTESVETLADGSLQRFSNTAMGRVENGRLVTVWGSFQRQIRHDRDEIGEIMSKLAQIAAANTLPDHLRPQLVDLMRSLKQAGHRTAN